jgi:LacI family transcriptional regulator
MQTTGPELDEQLIHGIPFRGDAGSDAVGSLLALPEPPTALIVGNTAQVRPALLRLQQASVAIPGDLSVIVFEDNPWTELVSPPLSVVRQPIDLLAMHSMNLVLARIRGSISDTARKIELEADFVERSSTAPLRTRRS